MSNETTNPDLASVTRHQEICDVLTRTYVAKNHDYGDSFGQDFREYGMIVPVIMLGNKYRRIKQLSKLDNMVSSEGIRDSLLDLANYAIMTVMEMDRQRETDVVKG